MATVTQIRTTWAGGPSAPGMTVLNCEKTAGADFDAAVAAVRTFWSGLAAGIPDDYTLTIDQVGMEYDSATGTLTGSSSAAAAPTPVTGASAAGFAHGVGIRIDWKTVAIVNGRRVKGRTFLCPWQKDSFQPDGYLATATRDDVVLKADTLLESLATAGLPLSVWSRPSVKYPSGSLTIISFPEVPRKAAVLRGRRD